MATEKIIPIIIDVQPDPKTQKTLAAIRTQIAQIDTQVSDLGKQSKTAIRKGATEDAQAYQEQIVKLRAEKNALKDEEKQLQKQLDLTGKAFKSSIAEAGSYNALSNRLAVLTNQFKTLGDIETPSAKELLSEINRIQDQLGETDTKLRNFKSNVGNYQQSILEALRNVGDEKGIKKQNDALKKQNEELKKQAASLVKACEESFQDLSEASQEARTKIGKELSAINDQIAKNEKQIKDFSENGISPRKGARVAKTGLKLVGQQALGSLATGLTESAGALGSFGAAGIAAFGVFAAGGLVFKGIQALDQLTAGINKTTAEVQRLSGASTADAKKLTDEVRGLSIAFGESEEAILDQTKQLQEGLVSDLLKRWIRLKTAT